MEHKHASVFLHHSWASVAFDILICAKWHQPVLFHIATQTIPLQEKSLKNLCFHYQKASLKIVSMDSPFKIDYYVSNAQGAKG